MSVRKDTVNLIVNINGDTAKNKLNELKKQASLVSNELGNLKKGTAEYIEKSKELKQVTAEMDGLKKQIGLTALSMKELAQERRKLTSLRDSVDPTTNEYKQLNEELQRVIARQAELRSGTQLFSNSLADSGNKLKSFGLLAAGFLGLQSLSSLFSNLATGSARFSDQLADLQRVTGLTAAEANNLNEKLSAIDTRTSAEGLRNIAIVAGKLGVAKADIFDFTKAVDQLVVSLGDELGDASEITDKLGKILNVFDGKITGDNISKLGNAFVELANTGAASGGFIADFDQRLSGIAKTAGISLGALSGLGAGLEELGGRVESSSTAVQKLIIGISADMPKAAKIAGETEADFKRLFALDPTEALLRYSQGLVKNKTSFAEVTAAFKDAGEEGARTIELISKLGTSADTLRGRIDLGKKSIQETGAITEAFELKNQTLAATLEKLSKEFNSLNNSPGVTNFLKGAAETGLSFVKALLSIPAPILTIIANFALLVAGIALWNSSLITSARLSIVQAARTLAISVASNLAAAAITIQRLALSASIATQAAYVTVTTLLTGAINLSTAATRLWSIAIKTGLGPVGLLIAAVGAIAAGVVSLSGAFKESNKQFEIFTETSRIANAEIAKEKSEISSLTAVISDNSISLETRKTSLQKLIALSPEYLSRLTLENIATEEGKKILDNYNTALEKNANIKAASLLKEKEFDNNVRLRSLRQELEIAQKLGKGYGDLSDEAKQSFSKITTSVGRSNFTSDLLNASIGKDDFKQAFAEIDNQIKVSTTNVNAATDNYVQKTKEQTIARQLFLSGEIVAARQAQNLTKKGTDEYAAATLKYQEAVQKFDKEFGFSSKIQKVAGETIAGGSNTIEAIKNKIKALDEAFEKIDTTNKKALNSNRQNRKELQLQLDSLEGKKSPGEKKGDGDFERLKQQAKKFQDDLLELKRRGELKSESIQQSEIDAVKDKYAKLMAELVQFNKDKVIVDAAFAADKKILTIAEQKEINAILYKFAAEAQIDAETLNGEAAKQNQDNAKQVEEDAKKALDKSNSEAVARAQRGVIGARPGSKDELEAKKILLQKQFDLDTEFLDKKSELYLTKSAELNAAIAELDTEYQLARIDKIFEQVRYFEGLLESINTILTNSENRQLAKEKASNDKKKKMYKDQLDSKLISKEQYDKKVAAVDEEQDKRQRAIQRKQAEREKALNIFNAVINNAQAIIKTMASVPFPFNIPLAIAQGIAGGLQVAAIANTPLPELGTGDWIREGAKHSDKEGGIPVMIERDEAVIKAAAMTNKKVYSVTGTTAQITSALNSQAGGASWAGGALLQLPKWATDRPATINPSLPRIMEQGGIVRPLNPAAAIATTSQDNAVLNEIKATLKDLLQVTQDKNESLHAVVSIKEYEKKKAQFEQAKKVSGLG